MVGSDPYLREQLIAYLGNKRALLPFLHSVLSRLPLEAHRSTFLDPFAGSGAVSRLARVMGFRVVANDWEPYAHLINACHLCLTPSALDVMFRGRGGLAAVLEELNALAPPARERRYISRHYAPRDTRRADWRTERLFYTRENALVIDAVRDRIEQMYAGFPGDRGRFLEKAALLAPLLYEAATHTNTSGVFKACHKGFGGHGRDALGRILAPIRLRAPVVVDSPAGADVTCQDASVFLDGRPAEVCYLDPPYSVHQYGSNYFMLNTIALWDRPPVSEERAPDGRLVRKAGIRPDWIRTRSPFCYRDRAPQALREVLAAADCRWLLVSYSNEGLIGLEELCDMLAETGSLTVHTRGYVKYPGGKQGLRRTARNTELLLLVRRGAPRGSAWRVRQAIRSAEIARRLSLSYDPSRIRERFPVEGQGIRAGDPPVLLPMRHFWRFARDLAVPEFASERSAASFLEALDHCSTRDVREEIGILLDITPRILDSAERRRLRREILRLLNKLAHRAYHREFSDALASIRSTRGLRAEGSFGEELERVRQRAARRLAGRSAREISGAG